MQFTPRQRPNGERRQVLLLASSLVGLSACGLPRSAAPTSAHPAPAPGPLAHPTSPAWAAPLRQQLLDMAEKLSASLQPWVVPEYVLLVEREGAKGDGVTLSTEAIQRCIDACSAAGGGVVRLSRGDYLSGSLTLRSGVMLEIEQGARLLGSLNLADYPERRAQRLTVMDTHMGMHQSLIYAEGLERVGIRGAGAIDFRGQKLNFPGKQTVGPTPGRPFGMRFIDCRRVVIENISLHNSACWMQNYLNCEDLIIQGITVNNHANYNNDGLDIDGCRRVIIRHCDINSEDDAMCIKGASMRPTEDVLIEHCRFVTTCNALKIGTDTQGDFRRIVARHLRLGGVPEQLNTSAKGHQASTGITLATVDGGTVESILIADVEIERTRAPIFIRVGDRGRLMPGMPHPEVGTLRHCIIERVKGSKNFRQGSLISGIPARPVEDVLLRDIELTMEGGGSEEMAQRELPEKERGYPDAQGFSKDGLPSYGFYLRHAKGIHFENVAVRARHPDARPLYRCALGCHGVTWNGRALQSETLK